MRTPKARLELTCIGKEMSPTAVRLTHLAPDEVRRLKMATSAAPSANHSPFARRGPDAGRLDERIPPEGDPPFYLLGAWPFGSVPPQVAAPGQGPNQG